VSVGIGGNVGVGCWQNVGVGCWWKNQGIFRVLQIFFMVSCLNLWKFIVFDSVPFGYGLCGTKSIWTLWNKVHMDFVEQSGLCRNGKKSITDLPI
jgi:hypothetical protein